MLAHGTILHARYYIIRQIGSGGTGCVYLAEDLNIRKNWAIKQILIKKEMGTQLAGHEVMMMKQLDYWMFPRIVDAWQEEACYYIVSDYIEGISMEALLKRTQIPVQKALDWAAELAYALKYLHENDPPILYLDLKPENIMVKPNGTISLIDFGIAQRLADPKLPFGTPGYAAPEQYGEGQHQSSLGAQTDIFAFGMTLYAMLSGSNPVRNLPVQIKKIAENKKINKKIRYFILHCIDSNPKKRFQNLQELLPVLKQIKEGCHQTKQKIKLGLLVLLALLICTVVSGVCIEKNERHAAAGQMLREISPHVEEGEYTKEGIKIICSYLNCNCLEEKIQQQFTYEAAKNYFEIQHNYKEAKRYFAKLDETMYPETVFFLELCSLQTQFGENAKKTEACLSDFYTYNSEEAFSTKKFENELLIAACFEQLGEQIESAEEKAVRCLERGMQELLDAERQMGAVDETIAKMQMEYGRRLCILCESIGDKEKMEMYGEITLKCLPKEEQVIRQDLLRRMKNE